MDPLTNAIQEYIKSGEYFIDARKWYNFKYILPLSHRSLLLLICTIFYLIINLNLYKYQHIATYKQKSKLFNKR